MKSGAEIPIGSELASRSVRTAMNVVFSIRDVEQLLQSRYAPTTLALLQQFLISNLRVVGLKCTENGHENAEKANSKHLLNLSLSCPKGR